MVSETLAWGRFQHMAVRRQRQRGARVPEPSRHRLDVHPVTRKASAHTRPKAQERRPLCRLPAW